MSSPDSSAWALTLKEYDHLHKRAIMFVLAAISVISLVLHLANGVYFSSGLNPDCNVEDIPGDGPWNMIWFVGVSGLVLAYLWLDVTFSKGLSRWSFVPVEELMAVRQVATGEDLPTQATDGGAGNNWTQARVRFWKVPFGKALALLSLLVTVIFAVYQFLKEEQKGFPLVLENQLALIAKCRARYTEPSDTQSADRWRRTVERFQYGEQLVMALIVCLVILLAIEIPVQFYRNVRSIGWVFRPSQYTRLPSDVVELELMETENGSRTSTETASREPQASTAAGNEGSWGWD